MPTWYFREIASKGSSTAGNKMDSAAAHKIKIRQRIAMIHCNGRRGVIRRIPWRMIIGIVGKNIVHRFVKFPDVATIKTQVAIKTDAFHLFLSCCVHTENAKPSTEKESITTWLRIGRRPPQTSISAKFNKFQCYHTVGDAMMEDDICFALVSDLLLVSQNREELFPKKRKSFPWYRYRCVTGQIWTVVAGEKNLTFHHHVLFCGMNESYSVTSRMNQHTLETKFAPASSDHSLIKATFYFNISSVSWPTSK